MQALANLGVEEHYALVKMMVFKYRGGVEVDKRRHG